MPDASGIDVRASAPEEQPAHGAPLSGRRVLLRPIGSNDHGWLYLLSTSEQSGFRWRYGGATPSPDTFLHSVWDRVLAQFVVQARHPPTPVGLVAAYSPDMHNGHVQVAALLEPSVQKRPWPHEAMILFVNYLFVNWNFRKLYAESVEFNYRQFSSGAGRLFEIEGTLRDHQFWNGRYWDKHIGVCTREVWMAHRARLMRFALGHHVSPRSGGRSRHQRR